MPDDPMLSCRIKIDRAKQHLNDLNAQIEAFSARNPYNILVDEDSEPAIKIYRIQIVEEIPIEWTAIIGDAVHNLRSALDSLATRLVIEAGFTSEDDVRRVYFPIRRVEADLTDASARDFFGMVGPRVEKFIRKLQPYRGGKGDALWRLNRLDIIDKHRRILTAGSSLARVEIEIPTTDLFVKPIFPPIIPPQRSFPLKEGDEILRIAFFESHYNANTHFMFDVSFDETGVFVGHPLFPTLSQITNFVERVMILSAKYIFRCAW